MNSTEGGFVGRPEAPERDPDELPDDPRLTQAVQEYLAQLEAGQLPNRQEILRRYPDLMKPLAQCLDGLELVHKAAVRKTQPVSAPPPAAGPRDALPADPLGDFQIMREIGRGGMGVVYEALQLSLGRRVALKVLPFAATFDAKHLQRFHNEAQAAAQLHHTNIVPVYAVGCERGVHFYAMQLIEGQSLAALIHQIRRQESNNKGQETAVRGRGSEASSLEDRDRTATGPAHLGSDSARLAPDGSIDTASELSVALTTQRSGKSVKFFQTVARFMVQAAEAVEHAHQFGIVHRDIKPANLLVDIHKRLWITDFGLAQFHSDAGLTQTGDIMGTLRYMSPEQASGKKVLDHRTDIYSLGATLYELVTLEPIFPGRNRQELLHQIINDEPRAPRLLDKGVPVELETIILKAVNKNPADRFGSAQEFADDLQRYLEDKPILAKRPSLVERARKWSRRHPSVVVAAAVVLVICFMGLLVNNWMVAQEQAKTRAALKGEKDRATQARRAVDLLVDVSEEELADKPFADGRFLEDVRRRLLETALEYYTSFLDTHWSDSAEQGDLEKSKNRVRNILNELATLQGAKLIGLAKQSDVQKDMEVAEDQRERLAKLDARSADQRAKGFREDKFLDPEKRRQKFYDLAKKQEADLGEILKPSQIERLKQIDLQLQGPRAFQESYASGALKLTTAQRQKIRKFNAEAMTALFSGPSKKDPHEMDKLEMDKLVENVQKAEVEKIMSILTLDQKTRWQELTGKSFNGRVHRPPLLFMGEPQHKGGKGPKGPKGPKPPPDFFGPG
jgi:serine/threonine protein kinase